MNEAMRAVTAFHRNNGFAVSVPLTRPATHSPPHRALAVARQALADSAEDLLDAAITPRGENLECMRAHLIAEEAAEAIKGLLEGDHVELLDGLADLAYVTLGAAVAYGLPLEEAVEEVSWSNLTKEKQPGDVHRARIRQKGQHYIPPDLRTILSNSTDPEHERPTLLQALVAFKRLQREHPLLSFLKSPPSAETLDATALEVSLKYGPRWADSALRLVKGHFKL